METILSVASKPKVEDYIKIDGLSEEMLDTMAKYLLTLYHLSEGTKEQYMLRLRKFGLWLMSNGIRRFEDAEEGDLIAFINSLDKVNTINAYITLFKPFYRFLGKGGVAKNLKFYSEDLQPITPSEILTPEEVVKLAEECGRRRDMYKVIVLTLYESCARINELLHLKYGDVQFSTVRDKEGHRQLIATLYFKRSKANIPKQPITIVMFASELKRYCENHPTKKPSDWLFPSPYKSKSSQPINDYVIQFVLKEAGKRIGIRKRTHPHWLRHSGLSFFANNKNYNEQLLMWRAGWTNTSMARRYIHSGAELETKAYLERMGFIVEEKENKKILPKTCPHCQAINPYTNINCDYCGMPLDLEEYKAEIEKRRKISELYQSLNSITKGELSEEQKAMIKERTDTITKLLEMGRDDLARIYIEKLLESWVKTFLSA